MTNEDTKKRSLKLFTVKAIGWGLGWGIGVALVVGTVVWIYQIPRSRSKKALVAHGVTVKGMYSVPTPPDNKYETDFAFDVDLENRTGHDVTLQPDLVAMKVDKQTGALSTADFRLTQPALLLAHHTTRIQITIDNSCVTFTEPKGGPPMEDCFQKRVKGYDLLLFDSAGAYEVKIPTPDKLSEWNY
jgi:hypothetical protein